MRLVHIAPCLFLTLVIIAGLPGQSYSDEGFGEVTSPKTFYGEHHKGWFFYNEKYDKEKKKKKQVSEPKPPVKPVTRTEPKREEKQPAKRVYSGPAPLSAAWLKVNLPKYLNKALDKPTLQNVKAYLLLQKVALDKSERFTDMSHRITVTDPLLDEMTRHPFASSGVNVAAAMASQGGENLIRKMAGKMALWAFYSDSAHCPYCNLVGQLLGAFKRIYGFRVLPISLDGTPPPVGFPVGNGFRVDSGQSKGMNVVATPAIYLVNIVKHEYISVGQGTSMSIPELKQRIFLAALQKHWITNDQYAKTLPNNNIPLLSDSTVLHPEGGTGFVKPEQVIKFIEGARRKN